MAKEISNRSIQHRRNQTLLILLFVACAIVYLLGNNTMPLFDRDEGWYAQISRTMVETGNWVVPMFRGDVFIGKPVFAFWCQAVAMTLFGQNVFAARLPSVIGALATLAIVFWAVNYFVGFRRALWTVFVLATSALFITLAKLALMDAPLLLLVTIAQICLAGMYSSPTKLWIPAILWIVTALAIMTKGPVILATLAATMIALALLDIGADFHFQHAAIWQKYVGFPIWRRIGSWLIAFGTALFHHYRSIKRWLAATGWWWRTQPWMALLFIPLVLAPWLWLVQHRSPEFLYRTYYENIYAPIFGHPLNKRSAFFPGFYLLLIWPCFMPWSLLLFAGMIKAWGNRHLPAIRFCFAAVVGPLITLELVKQKLPHYLLPLFPPLAFLIADLIVRSLRGHHRALIEKSCKNASIVWAMIVILISCVPWITLLLFKPPLPYAAMAILSIAGLVIAINTARFFIKETPRRALLTMGAGMLALTLIFFALVVPNMTPLNGSRLTAKSLWNAGYTPKDSVALFGFSEPSLTFYLDGAGLNYPTDFLNRPLPEWPQWLVMQSSVYDTLSPKEKAPLEEIAVHQSLNIGSSNGNGNIMVLRVHQEASPKPPQ